MDTSGRRKCCRAVINAMHEASIRLPSWLRMWISARREKHFEPAIMHSDSVSSAELRRTVFSRIRDNIISSWFGLREEISASTAISMIDVDVPTSFVLRPGHGREFAVDVE